MKQGFPFSIYFYNGLITGSMGIYKPWYFKKYDKVLSYLKEECGPVIDKYKSVEYKAEGTIPKRIWVLWWQGDWSGNSIVSACIKRLGAFKDYQVTIVSNENIDSLIDISYERSLYEDGKIRIQALSDVIRMKLLRRYGGIWCDSTLAIIDDNFFDNVVDSYQFYSFNIATVPEWSNVSKGMISSYFWASVENNPFFAFIDDSFTCFLKKHEAILDYFHMDFTAMLGYYNVPFMRDLIDSIPQSNPMMFELSESGRLNKKFSKRWWDQFRAANEVAKLNWRIKIKDKGYETYWDHLLAEWN